MKFIFALVAAICWMLVIMGNPPFTLAAVVTSFATLDEIINSK